MSDSNSRQGHIGVDQQLLQKLAGIRELSLDRVTSLRQRAEPTTQAETLWVSMALQELNIAHEELRVAEEQLHSQADELSAIYGALSLDRGRYRDLFERAPEPYLITDTHGVVLEANQRACELLNIDSHFALGKPLALYVGEDDRQLMRNMLHMVASSAEVSTFELRIRPRHRDHSIWTRAGVRRVLSLDGSHAALGWILHEQQKNASRASEQLDTRVEQLERELAEERRRRIDGEQALTRHKDVLAFVAHELRNPLNATAGWLQILSQEPPAEIPRPHVVEVLTRNVKTLARMVEELVDQTRVVQDQITLECEPTDLRVLLERICDDVRGLAQAKQQRFSCEFAADIATARCDAFRVQEALANVIGNACKFTPAEGAVQVSARRLDDVIEICVRDNGPGLAPEQLTRIFEPFIRVDAHGTSTGLGLGLNIARKLIELHGGTVRAESEGIGRGATFRVCLPLAGPGD